MNWNNENKDPLFQIILFIPVHPWYSFENRNTAPGCHLEHCGQSPDNFQCAYGNSRLKIVGTIYRLDSLEFSHLRFRKTDCNWNRIHSYEIFINFIKTVDSELKEICWQNVLNKIYSPPLDKIVVHKSLSRNREHSLKLVNNNIGRIFEIMFPEDIQPFHHSLHSSLRHIHSSLRLKQPT